MQKPSEKDHGRTSFEGMSIIPKESRDVLVESIKFLKKHLRHQGPLEYFVHHNPLHSLEDQDFHQAIEDANLLYGSSGYLELNDYRFVYQQGQISLDRLLEEIGTFIQQTGNEKYGEELPSAIMSCLLSKDNSAIIRKHDNDYTEALKIGIQKEILELNRTTPVFVSHRIEFRSTLEELNIDLDEWVIFYLCHILSVYFDAGQSSWPLQYQSTMLKTIISVFGKKGYFSKNWKQSFQGALLKLHDADLENPLDLIVSYLEDLNIAPEYFTDFLFTLCDRQKGWSAFILFAEKSPSLVRGHPKMRSDFVEYLLLLVLMEKCLVEHYYTKFDLPIQPSVTQIKAAQNPDKALGYGLHLIDHFGSATHLLDGQVKKTLKDICHIAVALARKDKTIWQNAFDQTFGGDLLSAIVANRRDNGRIQTESPVEAQVITCLDEREESFRRHLEEVNSGIETFGFAGNFSLNINYKGVTDVRFRQLGDLSSPPEFIVNERSINGQRGGHISDWLIRQFHLFEASLLQRPKDFLFGWLTSLLVGFFVAPHLIMKVFFPYFEERVTHWLNKSFGSQGILELDIKNINSEPVTVEKMAEIVKGVLLPIGLTEFADIVFIVGHGSHSLNNPHEAAHDCGACGGGHGFANAKVFSSFANDIEVRRELRRQGVFIPEQTKFIAAFHNTCSDEFDVSTVEHNLLNDLLKSFNEACKRNAHERCRKFSGISLNISVDGAYKHVVGRSNDLSQPRPEYGHATNAACIIGPRQLTRGLFLDRRAFLCSYDSQLDIDLSILKNLLDTVVSVCSGINLEYYFATVDNPNFGSGTKLPHNVIGLQGVINGSDSDLLLGLPTQMIEIHAPLRLQVVIQAPVTAVENIIRLRQGSFAVLTYNEWIQVHVIDQQTDQIYLYHNGQMKPVSVSQETSNICKSSADVYKNSRSYLTFSIIDETVTS